jgi:hydroxyacylglutathione hydrolase
MLIDRLFTPGLAQVAYFVADEDAGEVAVIDPRRDIGEYLTWAEDRGWRITAVLETHVHADFVSGAGDLAAATGAPLFASRIGQQAFPHIPLDDGDEVRVGNLILRAVLTPGHTPEHLSYLVFDPAHGKEPQALFSGDALFVGDVGRPDLLGAGETQGLANQLHDTVTRRFAKLGDALTVYPGHTAGSACGKKIGEAPFTTIGQEKRSNYAFQTRSRDEFVAAVLDRMPPPPTYYPVMKNVNKLGASPIAEIGTGTALTPDEVANRQADGAMIVDARDQLAFGEAHIPGAMFAGLGSSFTTWMGWLAPYDRDLVLVLDRDDRYVDALTELRRIGLDRVSGYLAGGMGAWCRAGRPIATLPQFTVHELAQRLSTPDPGLVTLDVRSDDEWREGHVAGAIHLFGGKILQGAPPPIDRETPVAIICGSGYRSSVVSSYLQPRGYDNLISVTGGMGAWNEARLPTTRPA